MEQVLCNFVKVNESTTGYFQGLNFVAHYIVIMMEDPLASLSLMNYVGDSIYSVRVINQTYFNFMKYRSGEGMMILVYTCERLIKQVSPAIFEHMQKKGISCQQFSTNPLITLFTWHFKKADKKSGKKLLHMIWDLIVMAPCWHTVISVFLYILSSLERFIVVCEMEDFLTFWEVFYGSHTFWNLEVFDKTLLQGKIHAEKLEHLNCEEIRDRLSNLKQGVKQLDINEEVMELLHKEYLSNHNNIIDVLHNINNQVEGGLLF